MVSSLQLPLSDRWYLVGSLGYYHGNQQLCWLSMIRLEIGGLASTHLGESHIHTHTCVVCHLFPISCQTAIMESLGYDATQRGTYLMRPNNSISNLVRRVTQLTVNQRRLKSPNSLYERMLIKSMKPSMLELRLQVPLLCMWHVQVYQL